jgi:hypothetical protein
VIEQTRRSRGDTAAAVRGVPQWRDAAATIPLVTADATIWRYGVGGHRPPLQMTASNASGLQSRESENVDYTDAGAVIGAAELGGVAAGLERYHESGFRVVRGL